MSNASTTASDRVWPFVAGANSSDLMALAQQQDLALRLVDKEEQTQHQFRQRCDGLVAKAKEFFYDYEESTFLVLQKTVDTKQIPEFIEYLFCWFAEDRLSGRILFGVTSEAGTHDQMNQQENLFREHSDEIVEALSGKYPHSLEAVFNYFNFEIYTAPPRLSAKEPQGVFTGVERLVSELDETGDVSRVETHYFGPTVVHSSKGKLGADVTTGAAHSSQSSRKIFANDDYFVIYDHELVRYVRTIESLHSITSLVYLSRPMMDDLGRTLNSRRGTRIQAESRQEIDRWENALRQAEEEKRNRISNLSDIL